MRKVYSSQLAPMVGHMQTVLESHGLHCLIKNEFLGGAVGELPPNECWPELWILDDTKYDEAIAIVSAAALDNAVDVEGRWRCPNCDEELEGQFTDCWQCGTGRPETADRSADQ